MYSLRSVAATGNSNFLIVSSNCFLYSSARVIFKLLSTVPIPGFLKPISPDPCVAFADNPKNPLDGPLENWTRISVGFFF